MSSNKIKTTDDELLAELQNWGGSNEMSAFEAVMWRAEVDPRLRSTTTSVLFLDRAPDWDRLYSAHRWVTQAVPRFRQRVVDPTFGVGNPMWVEDPDFDLDYHLRRVRLPEPGTERQLFDLAQNLAMTPFDKARSPWEATLIEGLEGGRAGYVLKLHHATSDGLGIIQLLSRVLGKQREPSGRPAPKLAPKSRKPAPSATQVASRQVRDRLLVSPAEAAGTVSSLTRSLGEWVRNPDAARKGLDYLSSAKRVLGNKPAPGSGLFKRRSLSWRFDGIEIPLADLKAAAKAAQGSLNDVFLAGLIGGFQR
ncbi:MAG: wax ester/triacylglycerol synthase domain-containing protein [Panacagrimonas sp.]